VLNKETNFESKEAAPPPQKPARPVQLTRAVSEMPKHALSVANEKAATSRRLGVAASAGTASLTLGSAASAKAIGDGPATLRSLMEKGSWRMAQKVAERCMKECEAAPHAAMQFRLCKIIALVKLRLYKSAQEDLDSLGDLDSSQCTFDANAAIYGSGGASLTAELRGSFVPFSLRLIKAELPSFFGNVAHSIDALYALLELVRRRVDEARAAEQLDADESASGALRPLDSLYHARPTLIGSASGSASPASVASALADFSLEPREEPKSLRAWLLRENRVLFSVATRLCMQREFPVAAVVLEQVRRRYPEHAVLLSSIGRVRLQIGDVNAAVDAFARADKASGATDALRHMNAGLLRMAANKYDAGIESFDRVLAIDPLHYPAANNRAIAMVFTCRLQAAIAALEATIHADPSRTLVEPVVFNLCTLYDLESENSTAKKKAIMKLVAKHATDAFDCSVLKLKFMS
jgi:trafficking protein particle complex subunit 12